jgi:hypothetical protein
VALIATTPASSASWISNRDADPIGYAGSAAVVALARAPTEDSRVALAGDHALVARPDRSYGAEIVSVPLGGGPPRILFSFRPPRPLTAGWIDLDASAQRAAAVGVLTKRDIDATPVRTVAFTAPPGGRLLELTSGPAFSGQAFQPLGVAVDEAAVALTEARFSRPPRTRHTVFPTDTAPVRLTLPLNVFEPELAGELVAYARGSRELVVKRWRTGARLYRQRFRHPIENLDLTADGRALALLENGALWLTQPSAAPRKVFVDRRQVVRDARIAGRLIVLRRSGAAEGDEHLAVLDPASATVRQLSPTSFQIGLFDVPPDVQGDLVAWTANGCALVAKASGPGSLTTPPGPCARSEIFVPHAQEPRLDGRRTRIVLRCLSAPAAGCRGTVALSLGRTLGRGRFSIPARETRSVPIRLPRQALRRLGHRPLVTAVATAVDQEGRRSVARQGLSLARVPRGNP